MNNTKINKQLRKLLNNFFQDVDNEAKIDADTANAIVDAHLPKFLEALTKAEERGYSRGKKRAFKEVVTIIIDKRLEFPKMPIHGNPNVSSEQKNRIIGFESGIVWIQEKINELTKPNTK